MKSRSQDYSTVRSPESEMSIRNGMVVRMLFPPNPDGKQGENPMRSDQPVVVEKSLCCVGHAIRDGARVVNSKNVPIFPALRNVARMRGGITFAANVIDPGENYPVCFLPDVPPQSAIVYKAA